MEQPKTRDSSIRFAFARRLRELRRAYGAGKNSPGMPQSVFATQLGLEGETYRRYERGTAEPTLAVLARLRNLTGASLDCLIAGLSPGRGDLISVAGIEDDNEVTVADRLRMCREIIEPDLQTVATVMGVEAEVWARWEIGAELPDLEKMMEFAHRFGASLDFLYRGLLLGLGDSQLRELVSRYPGLFPSQAASGKRKRRAGRTSRAMLHGNTVQEAS